MTRRCLILILCGIPSVGKSTFASNLVAKLKTTEEKCKKQVAVWICFDDIIPLNGLDVGSATYDASGETRNGIWKKYRLKIMETIDNVILKVIRDDVSDFTEGIEEKEESILKNEDHISKHVESVIKRQFESSLKLLDTNCDKLACEGPNTLTDADFIFILDDNFYYKSMRYQYFQISRKYNISFCQIHIHCCLDIALERNRLRTNSVPTDTLIAMNTKFEAPDCHDTWEQMSVQVDSSKEATQNTWASVLSLIHKTLANPVLPRPVEDTQEKEESRLTCLRSLIHQSDQVLRRLISEKMKMSKESGTAKLEMKIQSEKLNKARQDILECLRDGTLSPQLLDVSNTHEELNRFLKKCFHDHIKS